MKILKKVLFLGSSIEHFEFQSSEFNVLLHKLMNVNLHNINETEIIDFSEISSLIQNLIGEKEPFQRSRGCTGNCPLFTDFFFIYPIFKFSHLSSTKLFRPVHSRVKTYIP